MSALGAAVLVAVELALDHWFYLYVVWFLPLVIVALLARGATRSPALAAPVPAPAAAAAAASGTATGRPELLHSEPGQGAETHSLPTAVRLRFNQPMRLERLRVYDSGGVEHPVRVSRDAARPSLEQRGGFARLPPGDYRAEWSASSPAGETISGTLFFRAKPNEQQRAGP
ncbi:MAG: copper resistance protein CopC [Acetobacteraceae bacterium]|nr:copper resistance protein CopC [Acetobacteraceae bacterium]